MGAIGTVLVLAAVVIPAASAQAAVRSWTGSTDSLWSTASNWFGGPISAGDDPLFPENATQKAVINDTPAGTNYGVVSIDGSGYDLSGNPIVVTEGIVATYGSGSSSSSMPTTFTGPNGGIGVAAGGTFRQSGPVSGSQGLTLYEGGTVVMEATTNNYTGATTVNEGVLQADGSIPTTVVLAGGTLTGSGTLNGAGVTTTAPSTIDPGTVDGPGRLSYANASGLALSPDTTLRIDIDGPTVQTDYDQLSLTNGVALFNPNGATFDVDLGYVPAINTSFQIASQTSGSAITGRFNGIAQFGLYSSGPVTFSVGYFSSGVILTVVAVNLPTSTWDGGSATTSNWSDADNWVGDVVPAPFANLVFPGGAARLSNVNDLAAGTDVTSITIQAPGYELTGTSSIDLGSSVAATYSSGSSTISVPLTLTGTRTVSVSAGGQLRMSGPVSGSGGLTKTSAGTLRISGSSALAHSGPTTVSSGLMTLESATIQSSPIAVGNGGTLTGSGTVPAVTVSSGGHLDPTALSTDNLSLAAGSQFTAALDGTTAGVSYSQATVTGSVDVSGSTLATGMGYTPTLGDTFTIVDNDGSDAVVGTFSGLAEGATFTSGSRLLRISYIGGTGNDIVLAVDQFAPVAVADTYVTAEDTLLSVPAPGVLGNDSDVDSSPITATIVAYPTHGVIVLDANGSFFYEPNPDYSGPDSFTYTASDGLAASNTATVAITVDAVNDAAVALSDAYSTSEETQLVVTAPGILANDTDPEGSALTAVLVSGPTNGTLTLNADGSFTYTPAFNFDGTDSFSYRAFDGTTLGNTVAVSISVTGSNDPPIAGADAYTATEDTVLVVGAPGVLANDTDPEGSALTATLVVAPTHGSLSLNADGSFSYTPTAGYTGPDSFQYRALDDMLALSNTRMVFLTVNDVPVGVADAFTVNEDQALVVAAPGLLGNDTDSDSLTAILGNPPTHGTLTLGADGSFTYVPDPDFNGNDDFSYRVSDGAAESAVLVTITVVSVLDAAELPRAGADASAPLLVAGMLLLAGIGFVTIRRRRVA